jgi:hypothetical protein
MPELNLVSTSTAAAGNFFWKYDLVFQVTVTGGVATATAVAYDEFRWAVPTATPVFTVHGNSNFQNFDTTAANAILLTASWASTTGAPTITCDGITLEPVSNFPAS